MSILALSPAAVAKPTPAESWPAWTDSDRWAIGTDPATIAPAVEDEARPGWQDAYEPTATEDAWRLGFELGRSDEPAKPSRGLAPRILEAYYAGWLRGNLARVAAEEAELNEWYASLPPRDYDCPPEVENQALGRCRVEVIYQP